MEEIWKPSKGYEEFIEVSSFGEIKSKSRIRIDSMGRTVRKEEKILTQRLCNNYKYVHYKNGVVNKNLRVHRLVAESFLPNPNNFPCVNHKDENKLNNNVNNLEWCTYKYNVNYGTSLKRRSKSRENWPEKSTPICQYDLDGNFISEYPSFKEAQRSLGKPYSGIWSSCNNIGRTAYGFIWLYKRDNVKIQDALKKRKIYTNKVHYVTIYNLIKQNNVIARKLIGLVEVDYFLKNKEKQNMLALRLLKKSINGYTLVRIGKISLKSNGDITNIEMY